MLNRTNMALLCFFFLFQHGCSSNPTAQKHLQHRAVGDSPEVIALYEAWFGHPRHISIGYSSHDPNTINSQIRHAKSMGITAFVVDWYGDREPFIDESYALIQAAAKRSKFHVAMMYDETDEDEGATDEAIADFRMFCETYLSATSKGHEAYLTYEGRPVIFIFPKGKHTDWSKVRASISNWNPAPLLINENLPGPDAAAFDGYYAWVSPGTSSDNWGERYLSDFYQTMQSRYPDKIIVGGAWASFDDSQASWGLNRHLSARCGQTFRDTFNFWRKELPPGDVPPFLMIETWNDYEEGTAIERGIPTCGTKPGSTS